MVDKWSLTLSGQMCLNSRAHGNGMFWKYLSSSLLRIVSSLLAAALCWLGWLAVFVPAFQSKSSTLMTIGWLTAPVITSAGFAVGYWSAERLLRSGRADFFRRFCWLLAGCILGAAVVFRFGPMLIVFGMFLFGTVILVVWEAIYLYQAWHSDSE